MSADIPIKLKDANDSLTGNSPIVIIGPNGSGKTRHATEMAQWNDAELIGALRDLSLPANLPIQPLEEANTQLRQAFTRRRGRHWEVSNEINVLFSKLLAEDGAALYQWREDWEPGNPTDPPHTKIQILSEFWREIYPGRSISFSGSNPIISNGNNRIDDDDNSIERYPVLHGSDGERVAVYLAGRVLNAEPGVLIVDEPEMHFHARLGVRFWNRLEAMRPDCRFVYVTHDLPFALSRNDATFVVILPGGPPQIVDLQKGIPDQLAQSLLAAASFSIHATRIIFCEGAESSLDFELYSAWFRSDDNAVIPVGDCEHVVQCTVSFGNSTIIAGVQAIGIVDRDYWPERYLESLPESVHALAVHEVENIFCLRLVFEPVARYIGIDDPSTAYDGFIAKSKAQFPQGLLNKQISERYRRSGEHEFRVAKNSLEITDNIEEMEPKHIAGFEPGNWSVPPAQLFAQEKETIEKSLSGDEEDFLRVLPGKSLIDQAADVLGIDSDRYVSLVSSSLNCDDESTPLGQLGNEIETALSGYLPPRTLAEPADL